MISNNEGWEVAWIGGRVIRLAFMLNDGHSSW